MIKNTELSIQEVLLHFIHPDVIRHPAILEIVELYLKKLTNVEIKHLIFEIFDNPLPYREIEQVQFYLNLFDNNRLTKMIFLFIKDNIDIVFLAKALWYLNEIKEHKGLFKKK